MVYGTEEFNDLLIEILRGKEAYRHPCYTESCEHAEEMSWHFYGVTPEKLLTRTRPNEDKDITQYRLDNYEPKTKGKADKAVNITSKIFNPNLYSVRWEKDKESGDAKKLKDYTLENYPDYNSVVNYTKDVLLRKMLADPNAVVAIKPEDIPETETETLEPVVIIYGSPVIWNYDDDHYLIFKDKFNDGKIEWTEFEYFDKDQYINFYAAIKPKGKGIELLLEEILIYPYGFQINEPPVWKLRGMSEIHDDGTIIFKSFFSSAVPSWNDAIVHDSDVKASYIRHMFPQKYEIVEQCEYKMLVDGLSIGCRGGQIKHPKFDWIPCPGCSGSGKKPLGPYGVIQLTKDKLSVDGNPLGVDPVGYITVPVDATKMLEERTEKLMAEGMAAINMDVEDKVGEIQSGVAKTIDRSAQYDMLYTIGSVIFDVHLTNIFYYINKFMFGVESSSLGKKEDKNLPQVNKPTQFDILSTAERINNFKIAQESKLSPYFLQIKQIEIQTSDMTTNPDLKAFTTMLLDLDPLPGMADIDVKMNVLSGFNSKSDAVIHFNIKAFVERAVREDKTFPEKPKDEKLVTLETYAKEFISKNKVTLEDPQNVPA